jgi:hypothetical protein
MSENHEFSCGEIEIAYAKRWRSDACHVLVHRLTIAGRPLLVIDPEDRDQVERLTVALFAEVGAADLPDGYTANEVQAAIRSLLHPVPEEPTEVGRLVRDRDDELWVRYARGEWACLASRPGIDVRTWPELIAHYGPLTVLSPGCVEEAYADLAAENARLRERLARVHEFGRELQHEWPVDGHTHSLATKFVALAAPDAPEGSE